MNPPFIPGLDLSAALDAEVEPILQRHFPGARLDAVLRGR